MASEKQRESLTPAAVTNRMVEMFRTLSRTERPVGPAKYRSALPFLIREILPDGDGDFENGAVLLNGPTKRVPKPSPAAIDEMEEAIDWPMRYLQNFPVERRCFLAWAFTRAHGHDFLPLPHQFGLNKQQFERARARAALIISRGLAGKVVVRMQAPAS